MRLEEAKENFFKELLASIYYVIELFGVDLNKNLSEKINSDLKRSIIQYKNDKDLTTLNLDIDADAQLQIIYDVLKNVGKANVDNANVDHQFKRSQELKSVTRSKFLELEGSNSSENGDIATL